MQCNAINQWKAAERLFEYLDLNCMSMFRDFDTILLILTHGFVYNLVAKWQLKFTCLVILVKLLLEKESPLISVVLPLKIPQRSEADPSTKAAQKCVEALKWRGRRRPLCFIILYFYIFAYFKTERKAKA